jgi:hypothetical protein
MPAMLTTFAKRSTEPSASKQAVGPGSRWPIRHRSRSLSVLTRPELSVRSGPVFVPRPHSPVHDPKRSSVKALCGRGSESVAVLTGSHRGAPGKATPRTVKRCRGPRGWRALPRSSKGDSGAACNLSVSGEERELGNQTRLTLYRVAQEALTNFGDRSANGTMDGRQKSTEHACSTPCVQARRRCRRLPCWAARAACLPGPVLGCLLRQFAAN